MKTLKSIIPFLCMLLITACIKKVTPLPVIKTTPLTIKGTDRVEGAINDSLRIYGTGFKKDTSKDIVIVNGVRASIISADTGEIIVKIPPRAFKGNIVVQVNNQTVVGPQFIYLVTTGIVSTLAGNGQSGTTDGVGKAASFYDPIALALDSNGNLYVADFESRLIRKIRLADATVTTWAGNGALGSVDGSPANAEFGAPDGLAVTPDGTLYITDNIYNVIRMVDKGGTQVSTVAGHASLQGGYADGVGTEAYLSAPAGLSLDNTGNLFVAEGGNNDIRKITIPGFAVSTYAGGVSANLSEVNGINCNPVNNDVYVTDGIHNQIKAFNSTGLYTTFGNGNAGYINGIKGATVEFSFPQGLVFDNDFNVYVADTGNNCIRMIDNQYNITTLVGSTALGLADGVGSAAKFHEPYAVVVDNVNHYLYVADTFNNCIRKVILE